MWNHIIGIFRFYQFTNFFTKFVVELFCWYFQVFYTKFVVKCFFDLIAQCIGKRFNQLNQINTFGFSTQFIHNQNQCSIYQGSCFWDNCYTTFKDLSSSTFELIISILETLFYFHSININIFNYVTIYLFFILTI